MSRIAWNQPGERYFEAGVDLVVLYPRVGPGVAWNGVVSIGESTTGGDLEPLYYDGVKYRDVVASEDFQASLDAFSTPREFAASEGVKALAPGLFVTQQPRKPFDLAYRTLIGNDLQGIEYGYKLHLVYNCTAAPSGRSNVTTSENVSISTRSWTLNTVPPPATTHKPTAHVVLDSTLLDPYVLQEIETFLYGRDATDELDARLPRMPSIAELLSIMINPISEFIEATI